MEGSALGGEGLQLDGTSTTFTPSRMRSLAISEDNEDTHNESQVSEFNMSQVERNAMNFFS
jgi:hypothetical protein